VDAKIFQVNILEPNSYSMAIMCKNSYVNLCRRQDFIATAIFDRLVPSDIYGVHKVEEKISQRFANRDAFELHLHLQKVKTFEYDTHSNLASTNSSMTLDSHSSFNKAFWEDNVLITTLGRIWINVDSLMLDVQVHRERWHEHLAYLTGFNMFVYILTRIVLMPFVRMKLTQSLRKDIAP